MPSYQEVEICEKGYLFDLLLCETSAIYYYYYFFFVFACYLCLFIYLRCFLLMPIFLEVLYMDSGNYHN